MVGVILVPVLGVSDVHTCHRLWNEICDIKQIVKLDLIKFCESFTKVTLKFPQNSQSFYLNV